MAALRDRVFPWLWAGGLLASVACAQGVPPPPCGVRVDPQEVLRQVNAARAAGRQCGGKQMPPAPPLTWDAQLAAAAAAHASDMARRGYFDHDSPEGHAVGQRVRAAGYPWTAVAENIARGDTDVSAALRGWLASADHCENMMDGEFAQTGLACIQGASADRAPHWTMVFARRR